MVSSVLIVKPIQTEVFGSVPVIQTLLTLFQNIPKSSFGTELCRNLSGCRRSLTSGREQIFVS